MIETLILGIGAFVGTNIDDILIDTLLFSGAEGKTQVRSVVLGKYVGMGLLVFVSCLAAYGLRFLPQQYIHYLGIVPIALGIKEVITHLRHKGDEDENSAAREGNLLLNTALITVANGADNLGVYIPLFAGIKPWQIIVVIGVFVCMIAVWCFLSKKLSDLPVLKHWLGKYRHLIVPMVYISLGMYLLFT